MRENVFIVLIAVVVLLVAEISYAGGKIGIPKTGQTSSFAAGDDGALKKGIAWPVPRFTDNGNGTVTDNLTGLIWLKNANCFGGQAWTAALNDANTLASGSCGLSDGSAAGDWRLPGVNELESLIAASRQDPALPSGHPFTNVGSIHYWSSTTCAPNTLSAWGVIMVDGYMFAENKTNSYFVWPVRSGQ